jgi:cell division protein FtsW
MEYRVRKEGPLLVGISCFVLFGLLMVYSSSIAVGAQQGIPSYNFVRQSIYAGIGYVFMVVLMFIDYHRWLKPKTIILLTVLITICLLLVFTFDPVKGGQRHLRFGTWGAFQPSEMAKLVILFYLGFYLKKNLSEIRRPGFLPRSCLIYVGFFAVLIGIEPDLGQALCIVFVAALLLYIAGLDRKFIWVAALSAVPAFYLFVWGIPFRRARVISWLAALGNPLNGDYQTQQSAIAVGRGGILGVGLGESLQKFSFLPEAATDFIYAVIGEELGLIGAILVAAFFLGYLYWGVKISMRAPDAAGLYLGLGITWMVTLEALINISSTLAIIPTKGLALPFISRGGSSIVACLMATGVLLNIASQRTTPSDSEEFRLSYTWGTHEGINDL